MSTDAGAAPVCYRHPDRPSYVKCQRCGRPICPSCQTPAAVGVQCPECVREGGEHVRAPKAPILAAFARGSGAPVVTYSIMALCVAVFVLQLVFGDRLTLALLYYPPFTAIEPWTMLTSAFAHSTTSMLHIVFNLLSLFVVGPILEHAIGRGRFAALYGLSALGGSVAVLLISPGSAVLGASGAIFGLLGAIVVVQRGLGGNTTQLLVIVALNLAIGFLPGTNVSWQAHVGGLVVGAAVGLILLRTRALRQRRLQWALFGAVFAALLALTVIGVALLPLR